jgi:hypothetical protein
MDNQSKLAAARGAVGNFASTIEPGCWFDNVRYRVFDTDLHFWAWWPKDASAPYCDIWGPMADQVKQEFYRYIQARVNHWAGRGTA